MNDLTSKTTIVGASRGLEHGIASALVAAGADVVAVSRTPAALPETADGPPQFTSRSPMHVRPSLPPASSIAKTRRSSSW